ncbi:MAG: acyl-CoA dehydrogenase family protein [Hydrogenophaga sp.]|jgi:alkylation response protein AidB-like acyl-CoA dehydrogenase|uniref:acyl-CoA dehydrogenase family protein n=1 Tax=Hydrogenophaga sp. TaxID=1904254 RepID=UPI000EED324B|nr:acyl-CoA dehydrogenase family protein [Hydrogenophaga sp.]MDD3784538.1 acyl-CoA/acyl-ACP dehydrogenase [Hydrogenophaga sp.]MDX9969077.1 acyl-CoA dehydrogenase family protein [Hydrogenophaga sp.]HAJ14563.1 acyl-CoA dehydrogenase [Comamonadaceae bacterium]
MNVADMPTDVAAATRTEDLLAAVRAIAQGPLAERAQAIDEGAYPADLLHALGAVGAMSAHIDQPGRPGSYMDAMAAMAEAGKVCGATAFMMWAQAAAALYMDASDNEALHGERLQRHLSGATLGGTGMSNPMKCFAQIENLLLRATPVNGGYRINGTLPWVSNLAAGHYFGAVAAVEGEPGREVMFMLHCDAPGVTLKPCPRFSGMEGTGTYAVQCKDLVIGAGDIVADPCRPYIRRIRAAFVLLQCGIAAGITQGAIDSMWRVEDQLGHVNQYLDDRPDQLQAELDDLLATVARLAETPYDTSEAYFLDVLGARLAGGELCLRAANSALMHQGARGYLMSSDVQRRVREAQFVAIVTPAIKHLRKEVAALCADTLPA